MAKQEGVVGAQWCVAGDREVVLRLWQPACSAVAHVSRGGGDAESSEPVFEVYNPPCLHVGRHNIILRDGNSPLLCTYQKFFSLKKTTSVYRGESRKAGGSSLLFTVRLSKLIQFSTNLDVFLATPTDGSLAPSDNFNSRVPDYRIKASCIKNHLIISRSDGAVVAKAYRIFSFSSFFACKPLYKIEVYPGIDQAFIVTLVALQDKIRKSMHGNVHSGL